MIMSVIWVTLILFGPPLGILVSLGVLFPTVFELTLENWMAISAIYILVKMEFKFKPETNDLGDDR